MLASASGCHRQSLASLYEESESLYRNDRPEARKRAEAGLSQARRQHSDEWTWKFRLLLASVQINQNDSKGALKTLDTATDPPSAHVRAERASLIGYAHVLLSNYPEAENNLSEALRIAEPLGDAKLLDQINLNYGDLLALQDEFDRAEVKLRQVIESAHRRGDPSLEGRAMLSLGYNDHRDLRNEEAVEWLKQAKVVLAKTGDRFDQVKAAGNLAWVYLDLGALDNALSYFLDSAAQAAEIGDSLDQITSINGAAEILLRQHKYLAAAEQSRRALELARKSGNAAWETDSFDALAAGALELQNWDDAQRYNEESRAISRRLKSEKALVNNQEVDARVAAGRKQYTRAQRLFEGVLASRDADSAVRLDAQSGLGQLYVLGRAGRSRPTRSSAPRSHTAKRCAASLK